jgi:hypothetical protein
MQGSNQKNPKQTNKKPSKIFQCAIKKKKKSKTSLIRLCKVSWYSFMQIVKFWVIYAWRVFIGRLENQIHKQVGNKKKFSNFLKIRHQ